MAPLPKLIAQLAYVGTLLAILTAGTANMIAKVAEDVSFGGVEVNAAVPVLSLRNVREETFQREAVTWFEQRWGLRGHAVRTDNTIGVALFRESRTGQHAIVGDHGVLFTHDDINYTNREDAPDETIAAARTFARVQSKMRARGLVLVPVVMPSKTTFYPDAVPTRWRRPGAHRRSDENIYRAFVRTLSDSGARFVDARALLAASASRPEDVFEPTARHWRAGAGCRVLQAAVDVARPELPELASDQIDCRTTPEANPPPGVDDFDLWRLLNVWGRRPRGIDVDLLVGKKSSPALQVPTLFVGSSFVWKFAHVSRELEALQPSLFYYYDESVVDPRTTLITKKVEPFTDPWRADTFGKRLIIVAVLETYLPSDGQKFLTEIEKELDTPR